MEKALENDPTLKGICADAGYRKTFVAAAFRLGLTVDISGRTNRTSGRFSRNASESNVLLAG